MDLDKHGILGLKYDQEKGAAHSLFILYDSFSNYINTLFDTPPEAGVVKPWVFIDVYVYISSDGAKISNMRRTKYIIVFNFKDTACKPNFLTYQRKKINHLKSQCRIR